MLLLDLFRKEFRVGKAKMAGTRDIPVAFGSNGIKLNGKVLLPKEASAREPVPGVVLCHGFGAGHSAMEPSARIMARQGVATIVFDFRGHGPSDGVVDGRMLEDVIDAWGILSQFPEVDKERIGLVGHSLGAMSAILAAQKVNNPRALIALSCPPELSEEMVSKEPANFGRWGQTRGTIIEYPRQGAFPWLKGIAAWLCRAWMYLGGFRVRVDWDKFAAAMPQLKMSNAVGKLDGCSKLFVFCEGDSVTPYHKSAFVYAVACEPKEMILMKGGIHTTPLLPGNLRSQWTSWAVKTLYNV
ncbi:MAG: alpha/beta fold hydrolase [Chloroflexi bacterium]|nr:alpha/beta fold hydrolase [Chloroflexota bacterium]